MLCCIIAKLGIILDSVTTRFRRHQHANLLYENIMRDHEFPIQFFVIHACLNYTNRYDVSSKGPSSGINDVVIRHLYMATY